MPTTLTLPRRATWARRMVTALVVVAALGGFAASSANASTYPGNCQNRDFHFGRYSEELFTSTEMNYSGSYYHLLRARTVWPIGAWERYRMQCYSDGTMAIYSYAAGQWVSPDLGYSTSDSRYGMLRARASSVGSREHFWLSHYADNSYAFKNVRNGKFVAAEMGYPVGDWRRGMLRARASLSGSWERFGIAWD